MDKISLRSAIGKAALLVGIIICMTVFQDRFGSENMLVGITLITALLMFLKTDIGVKTSQAPLLIVGLFVAIVCAALLANLNPLVLLAFNLAFVFAIMYLTTERIEDRSYLPFMLCYLFIQGIPVSENAFSARLASVVICGIIIAGVYWAVHAKKPSPDASVGSIIRAIDVHSPRFSFALRMAVGVSAAMLAGELLQTDKAMWIGLTVFSLTQPERKAVMERFGKRMLGTAIGAIIFVVVFIYLVPAEYQPIAILLFGYIYMFAKDYGMQIMFITVNALATAALLFDPKTAIVGRIALIVIGFAIAFAVNGIPWSKLTSALSQASSHQGQR